MTSPDGTLAASTPLPEAEPPPFPDFNPADASFALELRAESIEQLSGGDALRRGESERIEAGRSDGNADVVAGRDRVQVQGTLAEHTGCGLVMQAAHLDTTVDGSSDTWVGNEDTVLLAGHMHDTWNGGTAVLAAMSDDTAAGGGVRATALLDLWVHGLMGLEERPGTCTADGVLAEACGTLYEREYRSAVHAAGLAVFSGTLYQSMRNSFRPLMRVSTGVRNLIAVSGGEATGETLPASPAPAAVGAGAQGAEAATDTLAAGRSVAETPPTGTRAADLDDVAEVAREAGSVARADNVSALRHPAAAGQRFDELREAGRGAEAGDEAAGGVRVADVEGGVCAEPAGWPRGALEIGPPRPDSGETAPRVQAGRTGIRGSEPSLGLLGGADDPTRPASDEFDRAGVYRGLHTQFEHYTVQSNWDGAHAYLRVIAEIDTMVMQAYVTHGGTLAALRDRAADGDQIEAAHRALRHMARQAELGRDANQVAAIRQSLTAIDRHTLEVAADFVRRAGEFPEPVRGVRAGEVPEPVRRNRAREFVEAVRAAERHRDTELPVVHEVLLSWVEKEIAAAMARAHQATARGDRSARAAAFRERALMERLHNALVPLGASLRPYHLIEALGAAGRFEQAEQVRALTARFEEGVTGPLTHRLEMPPSVGVSGETARAPVHPPRLFTGFHPEFPGPSGGFAPIPGVPRAGSGAVEAPMYVPPPFAMGRLPTAGTSRLPDVSSPVHRITQEVNPAFQEPAGEPVRIAHTPEPPAGPSGLAQTEPAGIATAAVQPFPTGPVTATRAQSPRSGCVPPSRYGRRTPCSSTPVCTVSASSRRCPSTKWTPTANSRGGKWTTSRSSVP